MVRRAVRSAVIAGLLVWGPCAPRPAAAYSVLAHEANIDALWDSTIAPMLQARFPAAGPEEIQAARAYAYGGCVIQDLGYYPFGSKFFSNLLHYVRSGDFIQTLLADAGDVNDYAFALGALAHYSADIEGHPLAVNLAVALMYPKLQKQFGKAVTYAQSPKSHLMVEFAFDVVQVASAAYAPEAYHSFIGFQVSKPLLERAFQQIYGLEMKDIFFNEDLAIGSYRHAVATTIPGMTKVAWSKKRAEILKVMPTANKQRVVFNLRRGEYEKRFGADYEKPHGFARFLSWIYMLIPKIGPFRTLKFSVPTAEAERLFLASFISTREHFRQSLVALKDGRLDLANTDFDTGKPTTRGEYSMADETYDQLLEKLADRKFAGVSEPMRANFMAYYGDPSGLPAKVREQLELLDAVMGHPGRKPAE